MFRRARQPGGPGERNNLEKHAMRLATSEHQIENQGLRAALDRWLRPAVGFVHPRDVLKDPFLDVAEKRAVLSSWASDASSVRDDPTLRWLLGTPEPVPLAEVREALQRLDRWDDLGAAPQRPTSAPDGFGQMI
jgi:hypothetical protein